MNSTAKKQGRITQKIGLFIVLAIFWVLWSGLYKPLLLGLGVFSCCLSVYLADRMGFFRNEISPRALLRLPGYCWRLLQEIIKSSLEVARIVLSPSLPISPTVVELRISESSDMGTVILGNSITLSPGTVTIDVHENKLLVHCLTSQSARELEQQESQRSAARQETG